MTGCKFAPVIQARFTRGLKSKLFSLERAFFKNLNAVRCMRFWNFVLVFASATPKLSGFAGLLSKTPGSLWMFMAKIQHNQHSWTSIKMMPSKGISLKKTSRKLPTFKPKVLLWVSLRLLELRPAFEAGLTARIDIFDGHFSGFQALLNGVLPQRIYLLMS